MLTRQKELSDLIVCSYHNWYEEFRKNCIKSFVLPIPPEVMKYLEQDFFILPKECAPVGSSSGASFVGEESNFDDEDTEGADIPEFPVFSKSITDVLKKLGECNLDMVLTPSWNSRMLFRRICVHQDQLALPSRRNLDHCWTNAARYGSHRCLSASQSVQHLQGRSKPC